MNDDNVLEFDDVTMIALAEFAASGQPAPASNVRYRLLARLHEPPVPAGFAFRFEREADWLPHPVPGIRMKVLALDRERNYATLLLDVQPGTRFPAHHHTGGSEECFVVSGSLFTCGRRFGAGDFVHADAETDHGELWTEEGCRVLLVVPPEDYMPAPAR
jgi:anti-sigma factor ChrR (cupin superfamily)